MAVVRRTNAYCRTTRASLVAGQRLSGLSAHPAPLREDRVRDANHERQDLREEQVGIAVAIDHTGLETQTEQQERCQPAVLSEQVVGESLAASVVAELGDGEVNRAQPVADDADCDGCAVRERPDANVDQRDVHHEGLYFAGVQERATEVRAAD